MCHTVASQRVFLAGGTAQDQVGTVLLSLTDNTALVECYGEKRTVKQTQVYLALSKRWETSTLCSHTETILNSTTIKIKACIC